MENQKTILIADDEKDLCSVLGTILKRKYQIVLASDGLDAIEKFKQHDIDLIIIDNNMPKMNGLKAVRKIRKINQAVPIIMMTGDLINFSEEEIKRHGVDKVVRKVFRAETMLSAINNLFK